MRRIHSRVLAIVMSIFLIQATDPPFEKNTDPLLRQPQNLKAPFTLINLKSYVLAPTNNVDKIQFSHNIRNCESGCEQDVNGKNPISDNLKLLQDYISQNTEIESESTHQAINDFLSRQGKTKYEKLLEKDFVQPLIKLYNITGTNFANRISKEDVVENHSKDAIYYKDLDQYGARRTDEFLVNNDEEHIGEILPPNYKQPSQFQRKSYDFTRYGRFRTEYDQQVNFPSDDGTGYTSEDLRFRSNVKRPDGLESTFESFTRTFPRRQRGYRDSGTQWVNAWANSRKPRVIFPSDLVAFRDQTQDDTDYLGGDLNLQDIQQGETRDRDDECAPDATCQFFLTCWMSGGLLEGPCGGLFRGCCHRGYSKNGQSLNQAVGTLEAPRETSKSQTGLLDVIDRCGISTRQQAQRRIVGGDEAGFGTFPWQAYIRIGSSRCGGSLVSRRHVVTAGHCVARATPRQVHVTLGDYVINSAVEPLPAYTFGVSQIQVHPFFKFTPQADRFDVAVLRLDRTAHQLPHIAPICLPPRGENFLGEVGVAAGWGALSPGSRLRPQTLQAVPVPVIENRVCERWHRSKGIGVTIYDEMLCAGYKHGGRDSCQGDSGGPLMLLKQGRWYLIGIVSAGYSCAQAGQPGIYHRVAHTVDWITRAIGA
ncbi:hypothetical protein FQR65_LT00402 [Abscondita terminalis]|nr:hypothetical protein FQR65_LT00402 [Abscondita terminalis]